MFSFSNPTCFITRETEYFYRENFKSTPERLKRLHTQGSNYTHGVGERLKKKKK